MSGSSRPLRVLLRGPYPPPYGGIASLLVSLVRGLPGAGVEDLAVLDYGTVNSVDRVGTTTIYRFAVNTQRWRLWVPTNWPLALRVILSLSRAKLGLRPLLFEVVKALIADDIATRHSSNVVSFYQSDLALESLACQRHWRRRRGVCLKVFGEVYDHRDFIVARLDVFRKMLEGAAVVLASSRHCAQAFATIGIARHVDVVYVGVDLERFVDHGRAMRQQQRDERGIDDDTVVLLFLGRFSTQMGLDDFIGIVPALIARHPRCRILLAGAKGALDGQAAACKSMYPDHVVVINDIPGQQLPLLYAAADIVVAPSRDQHACMGVTIKEAMAASRPVVGNASGGIPEAIVHEETGLVVPLAPGGGMDAEAFEGALVRLMSAKTTRDQMGARARVRAEALFGEQVTIDRTVDAFRRCRPVV